MFRWADQLNQEMKERLQLKNLTLHFDSKRIENEEYQILVLQNEEKEVIIIILQKINKFKAYPSHVLIPLKNQIDDLIYFLS